jgi:hydrogenase maturation protease
VKRYLVGLGNWTMGDDSVGLRVVEEIDKRGLARDFETVLLPDSGMNLIDYFTSDTERIAIVDAVRSGRKPGEFFFFRPEEVESGKDLSNFSTHEGDILKIVEFARQLGYPIPEITVMGIEPGRMEAGEGLSSEVGGEFEKYVEVLLKTVSARPPAKK